LQAEGLAIQEAASRVRTAISIMPAGHCLCCTLVFDNCCIMINPVNPACRCRWWECAVKEARSRPTCPTISVGCAACGTIRPQMRQGRACQLRQRQQGQQQPYSSGCKRSDTALIDLMR
jgi:hypothetical protein